MKTIHFILIAALLPVSCLADTNSGLVAYYTFEGNGNNAMGTGFDMTNNRVNFLPGLHGQAAFFDGSNQQFQTPLNFSVTNTSSRTISIWLYPMNIPGQLGNILAWGYHWGDAGTCWDLHLAPPNSGPASINASWVMYSSGPGSLAWSYYQWINLAITWDSNSSTATFYLNGTNVGGYVSFGSASINTQPGPLVVGYFHPGDAPDTSWKTPYIGLMDDLKIYNRALTRLEILQTAGINIAPAITQNPTSVLANWGDPVQFSVVADGYPGPSYLWYKDGLPLWWATNSTLSLSSVDFPDAGNYTVVVSNIAGSVTNSPAAQLSVNPAGMSIGLYSFISLTSNIGKTLTIQNTTNLSNPNAWVTSTNLLITSPVQVWIDTSVDVSPGHDALRYYRVLAAPTH
ncbi:MAG: LamG-like jellyroll fold domain-containing protein [Verrucomicrobiota bacterium]